MDQIKNIFKEINSKETFISARNYIKMIGLDKCLEYMHQRGFVDYKGQLTTTMKPFNAFVRIVSGAMPQDRPGLMIKENSLIDDKYKGKYIVAYNLEDMDINWNSNNWKNKRSFYVEKS